MTAFLQFSIKFRF